MQLVQQDQDVLKLYFRILTWRIPTINVILPCRKCPSTKIPKEKQQPNLPLVISPTNHGPERGNGQERNLYNYDSDYTYHKIHFRTNEEIWDESSISIHLHSFSSLLISGVPNIPANQLFALLLPVSLDYKIA